MSYALSVYHVPADQWARVREGDRELLAEMQSDLRRDLAGYDEEMEAPDAGNDDDVTHAVALKELFTGRYTDGVPGSRYGWAFKCLCEAIGDRLPNDGFSPCQWEWYERLDEILTRHGLPTLRFYQLLNDRPLPFRESSDWPCVGHWPAATAESADALERIVDGLRDGTLALRAPADGGPGVTDNADDAEADTEKARKADLDDVCEALGTALGWLRTLADDGGIIVGFHG